MNKKKVIVISFIIIIILIGIFFISTNINVDNGISDINEFNTACENYVDENADKLFLSVYGYLYDNENMVTVEEIEKFSQKKFSKEIRQSDILYIKPSDLLSYVQTLDNYKDRNFDVKDDNLLCVFTAMYTKQGVVISSVPYRGGTLTQEEFKNFILKYNLQHGEVINPAKNSEQYNDILKIASDYIGLELDVKYMACNDKYAAIVVNNKEDITDIREFVLIKDELNNWSVAISELEMEKEKNNKLIVNQKFPDFELGLLPKYNIALYGEIRTGFDNLAQMIIQQGIVAEGSNLTYSCGVGSFVYFEFDSGAKILGLVNENKELESYEVKNNEEAIKYMIAYIKNMNLDIEPPAFILKYD